LFGLMMSRKVSGISEPIAGQFLGVLWYALMAAIFITLGIGSIQARRWAHALSLILSYIWLIGGSLVVVLLTAIMPIAIKTALHQAGGKEMPAAFMAVILTVGIAFAALFLIALPIAFLVFYGKHDVRETCRQRDPVERWTDHCPLPVLAMSLLFAFTAFYYLAMGVAKPLLPFFGIYLSGIPGTIAFLLLAPLEVYFSRAFFQLKPTGWWIAVFTRGLLFISAVITATRSSLMDAYVKMGMSSRELQQLNSNPLAHSKAILFFGLSFSLIFFGYLLWLKKYFKNPNAGQEPSYNAVIA
ncbi:MAG TPA: hypothetical protein VN684_07155, partial [Terriglobales bacterium]|nr:hypothetical protein [Terriglobales bacterium]